MRTLSKPFLWAALFAVMLGTAGMPVVPAQDKKDKNDEAVIFELYKDKSDEFRFRLKEGDTMLAISGKGYKTKEECVKVINAIKKEAGKAKLVDDTKK